MIDGSRSENLIKRMICSLQQALKKAGIRAGLFSFFCLSLLLVACQTQEATKPVVYNGPAREAEDVESYYTENDQVKVKLIAKKVLEYQNGDREFPEGIYIERYDESGKLISSLKANSAFYFKEDNKWRGQGKVEVKNIEKDEHLTTEELFWEPVTRKIYTDKFVTIKRQSNVMYGTGLTADQDLTSSELKHVEGEFDVNENGESDLLQ